MNKVKRNGAIEFWRFIFSICIVLSHTVYLNSYDKWVFSGGFWFKNFRIGVEFFFLVSGYLMAKSVEKFKTDLPRENIYVSCGIETKNFILKKLHGFYPEYIFAFCLSIIIMNLIRGAYIFVFPDSIYEIFLLQITGMTSSTVVVGGSWYLSAMIFSMLILFPILYLKKQMFIYCIAPSVSLFLLGWLYKQEGELGAALQWNGYISLGLVRSISEICLGAVAYSLVLYLRKFDFGGI